MLIEVCFPVATGPIITLSGITITREGFSRKNIVAV